MSRQALLGWLFEVLEPDVQPPSEPTFDDVPHDHPAFLVVEWTAEVGLLSGYGDGTFRPDHEVTPAAAAAVLTKARLLFEP